MAGNFVGGFGGLAQGFMQGMEGEQKRQEGEEDRAYQKKVRQYAEEDRVRDAKQREVDNAYTAQVRAAQLEEIARQKKERARLEGIRDADAGVTTTEEIVEPGRQTIYGNEAPVVMDDDGNMLPGAEITPEKKVTRGRQWDAIYRDYAENRRKAGDTAGALEFTDKANKFAAQRSANAFLQVQAEAGTKDVVSVAQEIGKIFDSDPMNGGTKSIEPIEGGVRMTIYNKDTGKTSTREFTGPKAREDLIAAFQPYFRPEAYAKLLEKQSEIAAEVAKNPYTTVSPGAALIDRRTGRTVYYNPTDRVPTGLTTEDGQDIYSKPPGTGKASGGTGGTGGTGGKAGKVADPVAAVSDDIVETIDKSAAKASLEPAQLARAKTLGRQLVAQAARTGTALDTAVASEIAINVATGKLAPTKAFNPNTGTIDDIVEYQGNQFAVESFGTPQNTRLDPKQVAPLLGGFLDSLPPASRKAMIAAAYNPQARREIQDQVVAGVRAPAWAADFKRVNGRDPSEADINAAINGRINALEAQTNLISRYGQADKDISTLIARTLREAGYTPDGQARAQPAQPARPAQQAAAPGAAAPAGAAPAANGATPSSRLQPQGGMYTPDPTSPAGRAAAAREKARADAAAREAAKAEAAKRVAQQFAADKSSMQPLALVQKYDAIRRSLSAADAAELQRIERTIR